MIKFFRQIRLSLLNEGKTTRYFKYAVGEIVLVMIGILLALQVNNWNEDRKRSKLETSLLLQLSRDIAEDTLNLNFEFNRFLKIEENAEFLKEALNSDRPYDKKIDTAFAVISTLNIRESNYLTYDKIKDLGMNIISNDSLRYYLSRYYENSLHLKNVELYYEVDKYFRTTIYPKYFKTYKFGREAIPADYQLLKESNEIRVALDYVVNDVKFYSMYSKRRKEMALLLLNTMAQELNGNGHD
jgi:Family of unknown function (DUF6090)